MTEMTKLATDSFELENPAWAELQRLKALDIVWFLVAVDKAVDR